MKRITIGRSSDNNVVINNNMVSRYHCEIIQESNRIKIVDLNSSNGTFVNGRRIYGATFLNYSDNVCVHNIPIRWQNYFVNSQTFNPSKKTSNVLPIILGVLGGVLVLIATVYLLVSYSETNNNQSVFAEEIRIGMTLNDINNINIINADCTKYILNNNPHFDVVILDPPRKGSTVEFLNAIMKIGPKKIVYISCEPSTLVRDIATLSKKYVVDIVQPVDMFPRTFHVETIVGLSLKQ